MSEKYEDSMTKSELIERIVLAQTQSAGSALTSKDVELAVKTMIEQMSQTLASGERIEIRGFGSFSLHYRAPRIGRNPKTGESVGLAGKYVPHFKPGKELRDRVNASLQNAALQEESEAVTDPVASSGGHLHQTPPTAGSTDEGDAKDQTSFDL